MSRVRHALAGLFRWPTTFRFPTDCDDAARLEVVVERAAASRVIREARLLPGRRGAVDIEVDAYEKQGVVRVRAELMALLPPGVALVGGPSMGAGSVM